MKGFAVVLLCAFVAIQARSTGVQSESGSPAALGENPWVVHLRVATSTSGFLNSCVGTLYSNSWVLTAASCVEDASFIWIRYGAVDVIRPELVTETSRVVRYPGYNSQTGDNNIALVNINRVVATTDNITPISLAASDAESPSTGKFCGYGGTGNVPGEQLACNEYSLEASENGVIVADGESTQFDQGAPIVSGGAVYGILVASGETSVFLDTARYQGWIAEETGVSA